MRKKLAFFGLFLTSYLGWAAIYIPLTLDQQLREADGLIYGFYKGSVYKKLSNDEIVTEHTFNVLKKSGILSRDIVNPSNFKVFSPGGIWQGLNYSVEGVPKFKKGQESVVLLKKGRFGYEIYGLALGVYLFKKEQGKTLLFSYAFPEKKDLGKIELKGFLQKIINHFGEELASTKIAISAKKSGRGLASDRPFQRKSRRPQSVPLGLPWDGVLIISAMLLGIVYFQNKK